MSNAKRGLRAFGLTLVAAMGLMASMAAGASAITWDVGGKEIAGTVTASGKLKSGQTALLLVPAQSLVLHCTGFTVNEGSLLTNNTAHANLKYTGCTTKVKGVESAGCKPEILEVKAKVLPILHTDGLVYLLVHPLTAGQPFTTIHYNEETCALPPLPTVTGSTVFHCENITTGLKLSCSHPKTNILILPADPALFPSDTLQYGLNAAAIHGKAEIFLTGVNAGKEFNALI